MLVREYTRDRTRLQQGLCPRLRTPIDIAHVTERSTSLPSFAAADGCVVADDVWGDEGLFHGTEPYARQMFWASLRGWFLDADYVTT